MTKLNTQQLNEIVGGIKFSAALLSSITKGASFILELGRSVGTALRRIQTGRLC